jgi:hypothetical protein
MELKMTLFVGRAPTRLSATTEILLHKIGNQSPRSRGFIFIPGIRQDACDATATRFPQWISNPGISAASPVRAEFSSSSQLTPLDHPRGAAIR